MNRPHCSLFWVQRALLLICLLGKPYEISGWKKFGGHRPQHFGMQNLHIFNFQLEAFTNISSLDLSPVCELESKSIVNGKRACLSRVQRQNFPVFLSKTRTQVRIINKKMSKIFAIFVLSLALASQTRASTTVSFTCRTVSTAICPSGYQFRTQGAYQGITLDTSYCTPEGETCIVGNRQFNIQACRVDYKNQRCTTGVCFMVPEVQVCTNTLKCGTAAQPVSYDAYYNCEDCSSVADCKKCFYKNTTEPGESNSEVCLGSVCTEGLAMTNTKVQRCNNGFDALGQSCECCGTTREVSRFCTTESKPLSQGGVTEWFQKTVNPDTNGDQLDTLDNIRYALVALFVIAAMIW